MPPEPRFKPGDAVWAYDKTPWRVKQSSLGGFLRKTVRKEYLYQLEQLGCAPGVTTFAWEHQLQPIPVLFQLALQAD